MLKRIFNWIFAAQLKELQDKTENCKSLIAHLEIQSKKLEKNNNKLMNLLGNFDVSVDVHQYSPSWAIISLQGKKTDYVKFVDLGDIQVAEIARFISKYERNKVDATPQMRGFIKEESLRIPRNNEQKLN